IDVQVDLLDASGLLRVTVTAAPWSVEQPRIAAAREKQAAPLASLGQSRVGLTTELIGERLLLSIRMAENDRTQRAYTAAVRPADGLSEPNRLLKQIVRGACHPMEVSAWPLLRYSPVNSRRRSSSSSE